MSKKTKKRRKPKVIRKTKRKQTRRKKLKKTLKKVQHGMRTFSKNIERANKWLYK